MKTQFTPIAMRCTKKQFKAIEPKLNKVNKRLTLFDFGEEYLTNNLDGIDFRIGTTWEEDKGRYKRTVYETWDEATFLKACGIEVDTTPTLEEVKEYFKNAKEVICVNFKERYLLENGFYKEDSVGIYYEFNDKDDYIRLYSFKGGYAEIISYKDTYTVSKDFILEAHESACSTWKTKIENQFPELFPKAELEVDKWYKMNEYLFNYQGIEENSVVGYGFDLKPYPNNDIEYFEQCRIFCLDFKKQIEPATKEEVETALIAEAKKRGFKDGILVKSFVHDKNLKIQDSETKTAYVYDYDKLHFGIDGHCCVVVYEKGKWSEIISEPIELSLDEIAEKFGVDVSLIKIKK